MQAALIGCGYIGEFIAKKAANREVPINLRFIFDRHKEKVKRVQEFFDEAPKALSSIKEIAKSDVDIVIEAASIEAVHSFAEDILSSGKDMMILSVGAFSDAGFMEKIRDIYRAKNVRVYIPSGGIGALDILASANIGELIEVELTTIKNPISLMGAPYLTSNQIDISALQDSKVVFRGNAKEAIKGFPANVNVAVTLALAGIGIDKTKDVIVADPRVQQNIHEIRVRGSFGEFTFRTENIPSPENPKTSIIAALSAISTLKKIRSPFLIG